MKFLNELLPEELLMSLGWTLVHSLWQLVLVAGILWMSLKLMKKSSPAVKYGVSVAALVFSFALIAWTFVYEYSQYEKAPTLSDLEMQFLISNGNFIQAEAGWELSLEQGRKLIERGLPVLVNFWFLGALLFMFRMVSSLAEIRNLRKVSHSVVDFEIEKTLYHLMGKMGIDKNVQLKVSQLAISPLTFGTWKPIVLLPAGLIFHLSPLQLEAIIAHELAHVKRNDYISNLLLSSLEIFFFFHPCYWWMSNTVKELRENASDDLVVQAGIEPKNLATGLAEVLNFSRQSSPELALAAGTQRNPTLQRIKRILGYPSQNYPQTPIISIPMLLTLFLSAGLMASAQQDAVKPAAPVAPISPVSEIQSAFFADSDTIFKAKGIHGDERFYGNNYMNYTSESGVSYHIKGDTVISGSDTLILTGKSKEAWDKLRLFDETNMPHLDVTMAPVFPEGFVMAPMPAMDFEMSNMPAMPPMSPMPPMDMGVMPEMPPLDFDFSFNFDGGDFQFNFPDTVKMTKAEKEKWAKEWELKAKEFEKKSAEWEAKFEKDFAPKIKEYELKMEKWEAENGPKMKAYQDKLEAWESENAPKFKEYEAKVEEWQAKNEPKMKEFEAKMEAWQAAQEPKMKEWEAKMKEWETKNEPLIKEYEAKIEEWQKRHQAKFQEFEKLLQEELKKDKK